MQPFNYGWSFALITGHGNSSAIKIAKIEINATF